MKSTANRTVKCKFQSIFGGYTCSWAMDWAFYYPSLMNATGSVNVDFLNFEYSAIPNNCVCTIIFFAKNITLYTLINRVLQNYQYFDTFLKMGYFGVLASPKIQTNPMPIQPYLTHSNLR